VVLAVEIRERDPERAQQIFRYAPAFRLPRIALAELTAIADEHQQRDLVQLRARDDAVDRGEESVVLHQHRGLRAGQMGAGRDPDAFFFLRKANERHLRIVFRHPNQVHEPRLGQRRHQPDAARLQGVVDHSRA
jgi:hypothetical protein